MLNKKLIIIFIIMILLASVVLSNLSLSTTKIVKAENDLKKFFTDTKIVDAKKYGDTGIITKINYTSKDFKGQREIYMIKNG